MNQHKTALALANFVCGVHIIWALLVLVGWAQPLVNFIHWAHMLTTSMEVAPFSWSAAITLIVVTWIVGYVIGYLFAKVYNRAHK